MEHCDKGPLPLAPVLLGDQAMKCRAYAKALHYKEDEFHRKPTVPVLEALISINNKLGQKEAAAGLLQWGNKNLQGELKAKEHWYEKLNDWEKALDGEIFFLTCIFYAYIFFLMLHNHLHGLCS